MLCGCRLSCTFTNAITVNARCLATRFQVLCAWGGDRKQLWLVMFAEEALLPTAKLLQHCRVDLNLLSFYLQLWNEKLTGGLFISPLPVSEDKCMLQRNAKITSTFSTPFQRASAGLHLPAARGPSHTMNCNPINRLPSWCGLATTWRYFDISPDNSCTGMSTLLQKKPRNEKKNKKSFWCHIPSSDGQTLTEQNLTTFNCIISNQLVSKVSCCTLTLKIFFKMADSLDISLSK